MTKMVLYLTYYRKYEEVYRKESGDILGSLNVSVHNVVVVHFQVVTSALLKKVGHWGSECLRPLAENAKENRDSSTRMQYLLLIHERKRLIRLLWTVCTGPSWNLPASLEIQ